MSTRAHNQNYLTPTSCTPNPYGLTNATDEEIAFFNGLMDWKPESHTADPTDSHSSVEDTPMDVDTTPVARSNPHDAEQACSSHQQIPFADESYVQPIQGIATGATLVNRIHISEAEMTLLAILALPKIYVHPLLAPVDPEVAQTLGLRRCTNGDMSPEELAALAAETPEEVAVNPITLLLQAHSLWLAMQTAAEVIKSPVEVSDRQVNTDFAQVPAWARSSVAESAPRAPNTETVNSHESGSGGNETDSDDESDLEQLFDEERARRFQRKRNRIDAELEKEFSQVEGNSPLSYEYSSPWWAPSP